VNPIDLTTLHGCMTELEQTSRGLAYMDHLWGLMLDHLDEAEATWDAVKSEAATKARTDLPKAATAVEINAAITRYVNQRPSDVEARQRVLEKRRQKAKLERYFRSLEKRASSAASAKNVHEQLGKFGGNG
jgi:hypothetical protein